MLNWNRSFPYDDEEGCITHVWALLDYPAARAFDRKSTLIEVAQEFMSCPQDSKIISLSIDRMGGISLQPLIPKIFKSLEINLPLEIGNRHVTGSP